MATACTVNDKSHMAYSKLPVFWIFFFSTGLLQSTSVVHLGSVDFVLPEALGPWGSIRAGAIDADPRTEGSCNQHNYSQGFSSQLDIHQDTSRM